MVKVKEGDKVKVEYEGKFDDGTVFDSSKSHGKQLDFVIGEKKVIPAFEKAVEGMEVGEEKEITIKPEDAYGSYNEQLKKEVPRNQLPKDKEPEVGMMILVGLPNGNQVPAKIDVVDAEKVTLDLNHPLAGKILHFKLKVTEILA